MEMFFTASWAGRHFCDVLGSTYLRGFTHDLSNYYTTRHQGSAKLTSLINEVKESLIINKRNGALLHCLDATLLLRLPSS